MAQAGQAEYVVTRDRKDLLDLKRFRTATIVTPSQFIATLSI
jgi:predicted nucleic acid-binding protein